MNPEDSPEQPEIRRNWFKVTALAGLAIGAVTLLSHAGFTVLNLLILSQTYNDLKGVGLALHNYHDTHGSFPPPAIHAADGTAVQSWRSLIDRELGADATGRHFLSDDGSKHWNRPYQYFAVIGPDAAWTTERPRKLSEFKDGTSDTILLIAIRDTGVRWQDPIDLVVRGDELFLGDRKVDLSSRVFVLFADGSAHFYENGISRERLLPMLTIAAGDPVED